MIDAKASQVFEVSWEVCNKVGGIYTVVRSKAPHMLSAYPQYFFVGPYFPQQAQGEFIEEVPPDRIRQAFDRLRSQGIECHYGTWMIPQRPKAILIDTASLGAKAGEWKTRLWERFQIDSLGTQYFDFDQPVLWAYAAGMLIAELGEKGTIAHCHEWLAGACLLHLKDRNSPVATVFTTHATILGRSIASSGRQLYEQLESIDPEPEARALGIQAKFLMERAAAQQADIFTTVSEITAMEAARFLGRAPEVLLPNGLDIANYPSFEEATTKHRHYKKRYKEFIISYFFPYYTFGLDETVIMFLAARHEVRDKGIDVFVESLAKLNDDLKAQDSKKTIVAFVFVPGNIRAVRTQIIENMTYFKDLHDEIFDEAEMAKERLLYDIFLGQPVDAKGMLGEDAYFSVQKKLLRFRRQGSPPLCTHELYDEDKDDILALFAKAGLQNRKEDKVKLIYYPIFLSGADRLLDLSYNEAIMGAHFGVFPSYYEPWGYTPLEAGALGVASVTTDLSGFGRWLNEQKRPDGPPGIYVLPRQGKDERALAEGLRGAMAEVVAMPNTERIHNRLVARKLASLADWSLLGQNYIIAHNKALEKRG